MENLYSNFNYNKSEALKSQLLFALILSIFLVMAVFLFLYTQPENREDVGFGIGFCLPFVVAIFVFAYISAYFRKGWHFLAYLAGIIVLLLLIYLIFFSSQDAYGFGMLMLVILPAIGFSLFTLFQYIIFKTLIKNNFDFRKTIPWSIIFGIGIPLIIGLIFKIVFV